MWELKNLDTGEIKVVENFTEYSGCVIRRFVATSDNGEQWWFKDQRIHREDGPAVTYSDGSTFWFVDGDYHREDGPAIMWADRRKGIWYIHGEKVASPCGRAASQEE